MSPGRVLPHLADRDAADGGRETCASLAAATVGPYPHRVNKETLCLDRSGLNDIAGHLERDEFFWLDLHDPTPKEINRLGDLLKLHPLTLADISTFSERPKREHYEGYVSLVVYGVDATAAAGESLLREVHMLISGSWVVTLHPSPFAAVEELRKQLLPTDSSGELAHADARLLCPRRR